MSWDETDENGEKVSCSFRFKRESTALLPTAVHAKYLDILLAMFAHNWNPAGILHFRYSDVLRFAGSPTNSRGAKEAIKEAIIRYRCNVTEWQNCWSDHTDTLHFNIIEISSIYDAEGKKHSSRKSNRKEDWHTVTFSKYPVYALKNDTKRILLTDLFKKLKHDTFCVYRYYYGYPDFYLDDNGVKRPHVNWRTLEFLGNIFK